MVSRLLSFLLPALALIPSPLHWSYRHSSPISLPLLLDVQEALLAGRASLLLAEATWGEKAADVSIDYYEYRYCRCLCPTHYVGRSNLHLKLCNSSPILGAYSTFLQHHCAANPWRAPPCPASLTTVLLSLSLQSP